MSLLRIFLVLLGIVARLASAVDLLTLCHGKLSGTLLPNPYDCGSYYVCQSGPQLAFCGEGLHFDRVHKVCNWPETANCRLSEVEKEQPSHSAETLKEDLAQDESNEVKSSNPNSDFTEEDSNGKIVGADNPHSVLSQDESNEKVEKDGSDEVIMQASNTVSELTQDESMENIVEANMPNSVLSQDESNEKVQKDGSDEVIVQQSKPNSIEVELQEEDSVDKELLEELVNTIKPLEEQASNAKPIQLPLAKLPSLDVPDNSNIDSHGIEILLPSLLPKDPSPGESAENQVAVIENEESEKTPTYAIHVPIVVHGDRPDILTSNSSKPSPASADHPNPIIAVQVPVSVVRPNPVQITVEKEPPKETANLNHSTLETSLLEEESAAPENVRPTIQLHMPVNGGKNPIVNGPNVSGHAEENAVSSKPSDGASHIIAVNVPVHNFEITTSIVNASISNNEEHAGSSKAAHNATHVIQVHVPVHHSAVANSESVASPTPSHNVTHMIEVHVPVHPIEVGDFIVNSHNSTAQAEQIADKVPATEGEQVIEQQEPLFPPVDPTNSIELPDKIVEKVGSANELNHVIELQAPAYAADILNAIGDAINAIPKVDSTQSSESSGPLHELPANISNVFVSAVVERVDSGKPTTGSGQVIELPAQALPAFVSNAIVNAVNSVQPADVIVEKIGYANPTVGSGQVIGLPAQGLPKVVSNAIMHAVNAVQPADVVVEKVAFGTPTGGSGQVIELPAQALPSFVSNAIVNEGNVIPPVKAVAERVESAKPPESSGRPRPMPLKYSNLIVTSNDIPQGEVLVEKVGPVNPSNHFIDLSVPQFPAVIFTHSGLEFHASAAEKYDSVMQTSESQDVSVQSSRESSNTESSDSSEDDKTLYPSSEELDQEVNEAEDNLDSSSLEDYHAAPESGQSSEEKIAQSAESHEQQSLAKFDSQSSEKELTFAAAHESFAEELHHKYEASNEESPLSAEEAKQTTGSVSSFKPYYRPTQQRPISDVVNDKRPAKRPSMHKPKPVTVLTNSSTSSQIDVNSNNHQWNLTEVILSVGANTSKNGTIIRPIVGAHDSNTGDPIDVMVDYNSKNVQCIHNGLYFLPHPSNCQKYFICAYRHLHLHSCGNNLIWSYKRERCELEIDSRCFSNETLIATSKPEKYTRPPRENKYNGTTAATNGVRTSTPMPPLRTTSASTLARTPPILDEELPNCPSLQQAYLPRYDDCNKYYICILGHAVLTSCPDKLHWDAIGEFCGRSTKVRCATRVQNVSTYE